MAIKSGLFDIVAHFDLINKSGYTVNNEYREIAYETLEIIKESDVVLEINTSGLRKERKEIFPSSELLQKAIDLKIPLTLGSDAHKPEDVGKDFDKVIHFLKERGVNLLVSFEQRRRLNYSI